MFFLAVTSTARATLVSSVDADLGFTSFRVQSAGDVDKTISSVSSIEVNYALKHSTFSTAYTMSFFELLEAQGQKLPFTRWAAGVRYYPAGFNGSRLIIDQGIEAKVWRATPFIGFNIGISNISIKTDSATTSNPDGAVNMSLLDLSPRFGIEMPITSDSLMQAQLALNSSMEGSSNQNRKASYSGLTASIGIIFFAF